MADELLLRYRHPSTASASAVGLATAGGDLATFFDCFAEHPAVTAQAMLCVARVARSRFYVPGAMLAAILRAADPVVTAEPERLRLESFSACGGVHSRLDLHELDVSGCSPGTTNVDFNAPMREALGGVTRGAPLRIVVGDEGVGVQTLDRSVVERRVPLPVRWVKGFGEVQVATRDAVPLLELDGAAAQRFLGALPRGDAGKANYWAEPLGRTVRLARTARRGAVWLAAPERLAILQPLARHATRLVAYGVLEDGEAGTVAWGLELPGGRITVTLSPDASRGFSGEGGLLFDLAGARGASEAEALSDALPAAGRFLLDVSSEGLAWLGIYGEVGYDVPERTHFRRRLPYPREVLRREPPRLRDARALVAAGAVSAAPDGSFRVVSSEREHRVAGDGRARRCTCRWMSRHGTSRGPCKHVLATLLSEPR